MKLNIINNLVNNTKDNILVQSFIKELSDYLSNENKARENKKVQEQGPDLNNLREENCLYQVVDRSLNGVYLQNMNNNKVFEETNISQELLDIIGNDYILRYKEGKYIFEEQLTDDFFNNL